MTTYIKSRVIGCRLPCLAKLAYIVDLVAPGCSLDMFVNDTTNLNAAVEVAFLRNLAWLKEEQFN